MSKLTILRAVGGECQVAREAGAVRVRERGRSEEAVKVGNEQVSGVLFVGQSTREPTATGTG